MKGKDSRKMLIVGMLCVFMMIIAGYAFAAETSAMIITVDDSGGIQEDADNAILEKTGIFAHPATYAGNIVEDKTGVIASVSDNSDDTIVQTANPNGFSDISSDVSKRYVTLLTGQTVTVIQIDDKINYQIDADVPMHRITTRKGTYIYPDGVDFDKFDPSLFNIDLLIDQGLSDNESNSIPVIVKLNDKFKTENKDEKEAFSPSINSLNIKCSLPTINSKSCDLEKEKTIEAYQKFQCSNEVDKVYLDRIYKFSLSDSVSAINATKIQLGSNLSGKGIKVAVLDTGIDHLHPDLDEGTVILANDFTSDGTVEDLNGHGTHVAAIIAGDGDASSGKYKGVAPNASIINVRVLDEYGYGRTSWIIDGIDYAVNNSADIISMSLGGYATENDLLVEATNWAVDQGCIVCIAAGNSGDDYFTVGSPGVSQECITIGAIDDGSGNIADFSSRGPAMYSYFVKPELVAPGVDIVSARASDTSMGIPMNEYYTSASGTSMATPHVSGAAALILEAHPEWDVMNVKDALVTTSNPLDGDYDVYTQGSGLIDTKKTIDTQIIVHNSTVNFGSYSGNVIDSHTLTVENIGDKYQTLYIDAHSRNILNDEAGNVEVDPEQITVGPGESVEIDLTINTDSSTGVYSGRVYFNSSDSSYNAIFGYVKGYEVVLEKNPIPDTTVEDDVFWVFSHDGTFDLWLGIENGSSSFFAHDGEYTAWSVGQDESTGCTIMTSKTFNVTSDMRVSINESDTVPYSIDASELIAEHGPLTNLSAEYDMNLDYNSYGWTYGWLSSFSDTRTARFSETPSINVSVEYLMVPEIYNNGTNREYHIDSPVAYHLIYPTIGVNGPKTFQVNKNELGEEKCIYHRTRQNQTYSISHVVFQDVWNDWMDFAYLWDIKDRRLQTIYLTPEYTKYGLGASSFSDIEWNWDLYREFFYPNAGESYTNELNRHPYTGKLTHWNLYSYGFSFAAAYQADQKPVRSTYNSWNANNTIIVKRDGEIIHNDTNDPWSSVRYENYSEIGPGTNFEVSLVGRNPDMALSTRTLAEFGAKYDTEGNNTPPKIENVHVVGLDTQNSVSSDEIEVYIDVIDDSQFIELNVSYSPGSVDKCPEEDGSGWLNATVTKINETRFKANLDASNYNGTINLEIYAQDSNKNWMRTLTFDAFHVNERIIESNVCRDLPTSAMPGDTITVNLDITLDGANKTLIEDNAPSGWTVSNPTDGGVVIDDNTVVWIDALADPGVNQVSYDVTIPGSAAPGTYSFAGEFSLVVGEPLAPIDCDTQLLVVPFHTYDLDHDCMIDLGEVNAAIDEYRTGGPATLADVNEVIDMYRRGEPYC